MDSEQFAQFTDITGATEAQAEVYLRFADGNVEQAIQLFFESPDLATQSTATASASAPAQQPATSRTRKRKGYAEDEQGIVHIDSDDEIEDDDSDDMQIVDERPVARAGPATDDDAEIARRLQEEMYAGMGADPDEVRAPIERTRETLVGGPEMMGDDDVTSHIQQYIRRREGGGSRPGIFNQRAAAASIWNNEEASDPQAQSRNLSYATGGASDRSNKAQSLAEMFRPPFEIMYRGPFDEARDEGKDNQKWLLVNVQDPSIFDCQILNRDLWKNSQVVDIVKEHFIFLQYQNDDRQANYIQYYFADRRHDSSAYPHIAIVDPRTGEQVKVWSGPPVPKPAEFVMQLYEFLDRYSLDDDAKNPVAKRKPERKEMDVGRMTEEQMLEMALQNSLANNADPLDVPHQDPDDLTKSITLDKGKSRAEDVEMTGSSTNGNESASPFATIASNQPHTEPANDPATTTRIQFRHSGGRAVRRFAINDPVRRLYEWLKAEPFDGKVGQEFQMITLGRNLINSLNQTIEEAGLKNASVMVEYESVDD